jgi:hypothetical protein
VTDQPHRLALVEILTERIDKTWSLLDAHRVAVGRCGGSRETASSEREPEGCSLLAAPLTDLSVGRCRSVTIASTRARGGSEPVAGSGGGSRATANAVPGSTLRGVSYSSSSPYWADFLRSSRQWISWVLGCRHARIRYSNPGSSTIGIGSGEAGATALTTIFASAGMNGDCAGTGAVWR